MYDLCAIGNALVDIIVPVEDAFLQQNNIVKGAMALVDEATACALCDRVGEAVELSSGGSAANTLAGAAALGSSCVFLGKVGNDSFGGVFSHDLQKHNIRFSTKISTDTLTGRCLVLVTPDAQRSMSTFLGAAVEFGPEDVDVEAVQQAAVTYLEGYLFDKPLAQQAFNKAAMLAHASGKKVSMTLSDVFCVSRHRDAFLNLIRRDVDILFANENEIKELYQTPDFENAVQMAAQHVGILVATRGPKGALVVSQGKTYEIAAQPVEKVIDTTGAGDLFAAGFLHGLTHGLDLSECGRVGAVAAGEIISHYGPRPQRDLREMVRKAA